MFLVSLHDHLHQFMANDVFFGEVNEVDAFEAGEDGFGLFNAALLAAWKVDLGLIAGVQRL